MPTKNDAIAARLTSIAKSDRGRLIAGLVRHIGDFQLAEDSLQDAMESALTHWARAGVPQRPEGWLMRVAQRKAIDRLRRQSKYAEKLEMLATAEAEVGELQEIPDERLALIFTCCHPALEQKSRIALTLRTIGGLSTAEIARAFLDREATMGQRLGRAKKKIAAAGIRFEVPRADAWAVRLHSVLTVIYLIFNEGYSCGSDDSPVRLSLCEEAIFLARLVDQLRPGEAEIEGLLALMLLGQARFAARIDDKGAFVPLGEQDAGLWNAALIEEGEALLDQAVSRLARGPFQIQAAISALHIQGGIQGATDWRQILLLYDGLYSLEPTPVVALNRAIALAEVGGAQAGFEVLEALADRLSEYQPFHAARASLLERLDRIQEAVAAYDRAIEQCADALQRRYLLQRRGRLDSRGT